MARTTARGADNGARGRDALAGELRALALLALDRLDAVAASARQHGASGPSDGRAPAGGTAHDDASCPVCAVLAALRGERPELAGQLAAHGAVVLAALRAALVEAGPAPSGPSAAAADGAGAVRPVQHIPVERSSPGGGPC